MGSEFNSALCDGTAIPAAEDREQPHMTPEPVKTVQEPGWGVEETCLQTCKLIIMFSCCCLGLICRMRPYVSTKGAGLQW